MMFGQKNGSLLGAFVGFLSRQPLGFLPGHLLADASLFVLRTFWHRLGFEITLGVCFGIAHANVFVVREGNEDIRPVRDRI
jgi:hypothetical protein